LRIIDRFLELPLVYRVWQKPFVEDKLRPLLDSGEIARARRVLDVGCGPGTNTPYFTDSDYLGIDINPAYIEDATRKYGRRFVVADVTEYSATHEGEFDFILVNSMLHHIDPAGVRRLLSHIATLVSDDGFVHVLDIVLPPERFTPAGILTRMDRGDYPRPISELRSLVEDSLEIVNESTYPLALNKTALWQFAYFKCRPRRK